jgi:hypothetical protein
MKFYITFLLVALFAVLTGCGGSPVANGLPNANGNSGTANTVRSNSNDAMEPVKKPEAATTNNAPTISPVVADYYDALRSKNDTALKAVLTAEVIRSIEADMKEENRTDFAGFVAEYETMPKTPVEVRNEQITGDKAVAEIKGGTYANWTAMVFVKQDGKWKWTGDSPDTEALKAKPAAK